MGINELLKPDIERRPGYVPVLLAPMAGVTDMAFRSMCVKFGCDFTFTEMVSAKGIHYNNSKTRSLLQVGETETPCGVQLFGHESDILAETANRLYDASEGEISVFDINMGCPAPKITGNGDGSALMRDPVLAGRIISAVVKAVPIAVSVKFRKGWDDASVNAVEFARMAEDSGASFVTVHGRTRMQMYSGAADRDIIAKVVSNVHIPVVGNGDIFSADSAEEMLQTGCAALMVARGAQGNPFIFDEIRARLDGRDYTPPENSERLDAAIAHVDAFMDNAMKQNRNPAVFVELRKHAAWYTKGMQGATELRRRINSCGSSEELKDMLRQFRNSLNE